MSLDSMRMGFGDVAATDHDWTSPEFDHLQPMIAQLEDPKNHWVGGREWALAEAQRWRDARPYLIAHIRRHAGPKWDPRGATVTRLSRRVEP